MHRIACTLFFGVLLVATGDTASAQDGKGVAALDALRAAVRTDKRAHVASVLALTEDEAKKFWPIYDSYQRAIEQANRRRSVALVEVAGLGKPIGDLHARNVAKELVSADEAELNARRTLRERVSRALPPRKAIRYLQLEWQIRAAQNYDLAATIPLLAP